MSTPFDRFIEKLSKDEQLQYHQLKDEYSVSKNDPLWASVIIHDMTKKSGNEIAKIIEERTQLFKNSMIDVSTEIISDLDHGIKNTASIAAKIEAEKEIIPALEKQLNKVLRKIEDEKEYRGFRLTKYIGTGLFHIITGLGWVYAGLWIANLDPEILGYLNNYIGGLFK